MKRPNKSALDHRKNFNVQYDAVTQNDLTPKDNVSYVIGPRNRHSLIPPFRSSYKILFPDMV